MVPSFHCEVYTMYGRHQLHWKKTNKMESIEPFRVAFGKYYSTDHTKLLTKIQVIPKSNCGTSAEFLISLFQVHTLVMIH